MRKLQDADAMLNAGKDLAAVLQALEVSQSTHEPWRSRYRGSLVVQLHNTVRPHCSPGYQPPASVAIQPVRTKPKRLKRDDVAKSVIEEPTPVAAWKLVQATAAPDELVYITGSFFIAAELRWALLADGSAS